MKSSDIALLIVALILLIWPAKVLILGETWTWLAIANGFGGIFCAAAATANWKRRSD